MVGEKGWRDREIEKRQVVRQVERQGGVEG